MKLVLSEHSSFLTSDLSTEDIAFLNQRHSLHVKLRFHQDQKTEIRSSHHVGLIILPSGHEISIKPKIPVYNLLYMVSVVHELPDFKYPDAKECSVDESLLEIYAIVLLNWVDFLIKKGFYKRYFPVEEKISGLKGKFLIEKNFIDRQRFWCEFDEITFDTIENRIIKSTLIRILKSPVREILKQRALRIIRLLGPISYAELSNELFVRPVYHRLNFHYKSIIELCALIFHNLKLNDTPGSNPFSGFLVDMNILFQNFILKTLIKLFPEKNISPSRMASWAKPLGNPDLLPVIKPDILIKENFIIDAKYYPSPLNEKGKFHSDNLYQILTYMHAYNLDGMLLYPENQIKMKESFIFNNRTLTVKTVDLKQNWKQIEENLKKLEEFFKTNKANLVPTISADSKVHIPC